MHEMCVACFSRMTPLCKPSSLSVILCLQSFLDRVNIGNARLYGMEKDLDLTGNKYQTAVSLLFVTYILSE
jgi:hypothetical protein